MKKMNIFAVLTASLLTLFVVHVAAAQEGPTVIVDNRSGEKRRICFHRIDYNPKTKSRKVRILAAKCLNVDAKKSVTWDRKGDKFELHVKLYKPRKVSAKNPRLLHTLLASGRVGHMSTIQYVELKKGKEFRTSGMDERGTRFILKMCNNHVNEPVFLTLGFGLRHYSMDDTTEGWWTLKKGECKNVPVSEMLFDTRKLPYGKMPWTYFYARTHGKNPRFRRSDAQGPSFCINETKKFVISQTVRVSGIPRPYPCVETGETKVRFRLLQDPDYDKEYYFLNF